MNILITGYKGFIGKNINLKLQELNNYNISFYDRGDDLKQKLIGCEVVLHLAGSNRPESNDEFYKTNSELTHNICRIINEENLNIKVIFSSTIHVDKDNDYGKSKKQAEEHLLNLSENTSSSAKVLRLPNMFGKWCRPNYNSVVATFCHNIANNLPIQINDPSIELNLMYIDDLMELIVDLVQSDDTKTEIIEITNTFNTTLGNIADLLYKFRDLPESYTIPKVGTGFERALYSTFLSYKSPDQFSYNVTQHEDVRGKFVEMLKTTDSGQFSYFTAKPGITRGGHYHHTKNEKFLVVAGKARFKFKHLLTSEKYELIVDSQQAEIVDTVPGWSHDITNIGENELVVLLWANEIFNRDKPDTIQHGLD